MLNASVYIRGFGLMNMNIYKNRADISVDVQWLMIIVFLL